MKTTLNEIRAHGPCASGWSKLLKNLGKTQADDEPLAITTILDSNDLDDAMWCLRAVEGYQSEMRMYAVDCARSVQHWTKDSRSITAIDVAERHANGLATYEELFDAENAAIHALKDAASSYNYWESGGYLAEYAARIYAMRAARYAAKHRAWDAAWRAALWNNALAKTHAMRAAWNTALPTGRVAADHTNEEIQADFLRIMCAEIELRSAV